MSAEAPGEVREGFYDLPEVPGVPGLATDAMKAIMASVYRLYFSRPALEPSAAKTS